MGKNLEMCDFYTRRMAVLESKFPEILEAPKSIQDEYFALNSLTDTLRTPAGIGDDIQSDGCTIDTRYEEKYRNALKKYSTARAENESIYITLEEDASFEFPKIDFDGFEQRINDMKSVQDYYPIYEDMLPLLNGNWPSETRRKLSELQKQLTMKSIEIEDRPNESVEQMENNSKVPVQDTIFKKIYRKARGGLTEALSKLGSMFRRQSQENDKDIRE